MKIRRVLANNRRKVFEVTLGGKKRLVFPFARLEVQPTSDDPIANVYVDRELGAEGFTYVLKSGREGTVHVEDVLEYNRDPDHLRDLLRQRIVELDKEINRTDSFEFKHELQQLDRTLERLVGTLTTALESARAGQAG